MVMMRMKFGSGPNEKMISKMDYIDHMDYHKSKPYDKETDTLFALPKQNKRTPSKCVITHRTMTSKEIEVHTIQEMNRSPTPIESIHIPKIDIREFESQLLTSPKASDYQNQISPRMAHIKLKNTDLNSFKSLYVQNLVKGSTSPKVATPKMNFTTALEFPKMKQDTKTQDQVSPKTTLLPYLSDVETRSPRGFRVSSTFGSSKAYHFLAADIPP